MRRTLRKGPAEIAVLEGGRHAFTVAAGEPDTVRFLAPPGNNTGHFGSDLTGFIRFQLKILGHAQRQLYGSALVVKVDSVGEDARAYVDRDRIEVISGAKRPAIGTRVEKAVIA
jgi:hypothetical protein